MAGVDGRIALVTGAGRGIGRATAELLVSKGARVMAVARSEHELAALGFEYAVADLGTPEGCAHAVAQTEQRLGPIEILICNHGNRATPGANRDPDLQPRHRLGPRAGDLGARSEDLERDDADQPRRTFPPLALGGAWDGRTPLRARRLHQLDGGPGRRVRG